MAFIGNDTACTDFCKALGLDPNITRKVTLTMEVGNVVMIDAEMFAEKDGLKQIGELVTKKYKVVPRDEPSVVLDSTHITFPKAD